ncbi:exonuclease domain-containing protein [Algoriphagus sanaruensis]|uniref:DNA polymerase III subunit epsilon n=1 Tax=Algoriphagus sanaruensis TaxID=1727163 RepID=A0A142EQE8_9BACT|nr:exonuclease domain-containing protein [Algoriphagus sanaruensis]AMQ57353.1 DNA polymerase III subunit epsilon [Algoriphagus sanaruensis]
MQFAIVDIETTGGAPSGGGITEIAVVLHDGEKITGEFQTLLNPQQYIPGFITGLTGIDQQMVADAPVFEEIADELWELLKDRVFVAHNVNFDFSFIREAFSKNGKTWNPPRLCTVRMARKAIPGMGSYSLGRLCESLRIPILARHRAMGDAKATAILFDKIIREKSDIVYSSLKKNSGESYLPPNFPLSKFRQIPEACGVYYMLNAKGKVIYVGKANNIKERFKGHFSGKVLPQLKQKLKEEVTDLKWQITGSEFMALLIEMLEIKRIWPIYNSALKSPKSLWGIFHYQDGSGFSRFQISKTTKNLRPLETFFSQEEAKQYLQSATETYQLCGKLNGLHKVSCNHLNGATCLGACFSNESPKSYNQRAEEWVQLLSTSKKDILIKLEGRSKDEVAACVFSGGVLTRYGFVASTEVEIEQLEKVNPVPETFYILRQYLHQFDLSQITVLERKIEESPWILNFG